MIKGFIFDLDGVIVDTAIHHFQAWKALARRRGYLLGEDAAAGIEAAHNAGMPAVGIGNPALLCQAELVLPEFSGVSVDDVIDKLMRRIGQTHVVT